MRGLVALAVSAVVVLAVGAAGSAAAPARSAACAKGKVAWTFDGKQTCVSKAQAAKPVKRAKAVGHDGPLLRIALADAWMRPFVRVTPSQRLRQISARADDIVVSLLALGESKIARADRRAQACGRGRDGRRPDRGDEVARQRHEGDAQRLRVARSERRDRLVVRDRSEDHGRRRQLLRLERRRREPRPRRLVPLAERRGRGVRLEALRRQLHARGPRTAVHRTDGPPDDRARRRPGRRRRAARVLRRRHDRRGFHPHGAPRAQRVEHAREGSRRRRRGQRRHRGLVRGVASDDGHDGRRGRAAAGLLDAGSARARPSRSALTCAGIRPRHPGRERSVRRGGEELVRGQLHGHVREAEADQAQPRPARSRVDHAEDQGGTRVGGTWVMRTAQGGRVTPMRTKNGPNNPAEFVFTAGAAKAGSYYLFHGFVTSPAGRSSFGWGVDRGDTIPLFDVTVQLKQVLTPPPGTCGPFTLLDGTLKGKADKRDAKNPRLSKGPGTYSGTLGAFSQCEDPLRESKVAGRASFTGQWTKDGKLVVMWFAESPPVFRLSGFLTVPKKNGPTTYSRTETDSGGGKITTTVTVTVTGLRSG